MHSVWLFAAAFIAVGCSRVHPSEEAPQKRAPSSTNVHLAIGVQTDAKVRSERVTREVLGRTVEIAGEIVSTPDRTARVSSPVAGRLDSVRFGEGETVKKGEPLAVLRVPDLGRLRGELATAAARATAARADANRLKGLSERQLATEQAYLDAEAQAKSFEAQTAALREQIGAMGAPSETDSGFQVTLRAPVDGVVVSREALVGQPLRSDQTIATVADLSRVWFVAQVFERDLPLVDIGATARVRLTALPDRTVDASVELLGRALDPATRTTSVRIPIDNRDGAIRIGMTGLARIMSKANAADAGPPVVTIPRAALADLGGRRVVFVKKGPEEFEPRDVETGAAAGDRLAVVRGVNEGDEIVVDGVFTLKSIALKSSFTEE
ncbi:MAG: efflux RND transporter periplasmic adaptor subunit [Labilithrix sp.]|nr:efflux RND transporter periplasmic adaptor subunit [Labilithrix sp.]MCW5811635.1 efflux RND transporter periplasmic adaptor subunit [Labilithrix sp.]